MCLDHTAVKTVFPKENTMLKWEKIENKFPITALITGDFETSFQPVTQDSEEDTGK